VEAASAYLVGLTWRTLPRLAQQIDTALEADRTDRRALWLSLAGLAVTAALQEAVVVVSGSVALLGDTLHNIVDALTAVPLLVAFRLARRPANTRYTDSYGGAEDLAGLFVVVMIALSRRAGRLRRPSIGS
jgi:divalent metal cation (Fe/Co/Zn/Cd) transporter